MIISKKEQLLIKNLITESEKRTKSEIVPMIVHYSDDYPAAKFRIAILCSFISSLILYFSPLSIINPIYFLIIQIPGLMTGYLLSYFPFVKRLFVYSHEKKIEVKQRAIEAFYKHNIHLTKNHLGVLIFISIFEKRIEIITDTGIHKTINNKIFEDIVANYKEDIKKQSYSDAIKNIITAVTNVLENYFPNDLKNKPNQLNNELIEE